MEHTKKFILVDPRFARPSMKDKALSGLDTDISSILESDEPDEIKMQKYAASLKRFKSYSAPRSIKPVIQPKKDAKYEHLLERLNQLKQKQRVQTPVVSVDQRSEIDELEIRLTPPRITT